MGQAWPPGTPCDRHSYYCASRCFSLYLLLFAVAAAIVADGSPSTRWLDVSGTGLGTRGMLSFNSTRRTAATADAAAIGIGAQPQLAPSPSDGENERLATESSNATADDSHGRRNPAVQTTSTHLTRRDALAVTAHDTPYILPESAIPDVPVNAENISRVSTWQDDLDRLPPVNSSNRRQLAACDYTSGRWVYDPKRRTYSSRCQWIRSAFNCQHNGRKDTAYTKYSWRPHGCTLRRFDRTYFKTLLRNKIVAFVGDSFARNMQQAIACELAVDDHVELWSAWLGGALVSGLTVPRYNLRLVAIVSPYLVRYTNADWAFKQYGMKPGDGSRYVVWLDEMDPQWAAVLQHVDLTVFMSGHWFLDSQGSTDVRSTVYVAKNKVVRLSGMNAYRVAIENVKRFVTVEKKYRGVPMWLTYSPSHYSRGNPPTCRRTTPISTKRVQSVVSRDISSTFRGLEVRQLRKSPFRIIDITRISLFRPDAHVQKFYGATTNSKTKWDCTHWCLPGVPDVWADVFQFVLKTQLRRHKK